MKNLYKSLAKFQKEVKNIPKNSKGYGYDYAKLEDIIRIVTPTLNKNGLVLIQSIDTDEHSSKRKMFETMEKRKVMG